MTLALSDIRGRATITVPEAGQVLGVNRNTAYRAAERGDIPTLHLGRRLLVPVPKLLELLGIPQTESEPAASTATGLATIHALTKERIHSDDDPDPAV